MRKTPNYLDCVQLNTYDLMLSEIKLLKEELDDSDIDLDDFKSGLRTVLRMKDEFDSFLASSLKNEEV